MRVMLVVSTVANLVSTWEPAYIHDQGRTLESGLDDVKRMNSKRGDQASRQSSNEF
jgi:hypothetical protein